MCCWSAAAARSPSARQPLNRPASAARSSNRGRGRKINVFKYKSKTRYRRLRGHRQLHTAVLVNEVSLGDQSWTAPVAEAPSEPEAEDVEAVEESEAPVDEVEAVAEESDDAPADDENPED